MRGTICGAGTDKHKQGKGKEEKQNFFFPHPAFYLN